MTGTSTGSSSDAAVGALTRAAVGDPVLVLDEVRVRFGGVAALDGVSLQLHRGELCGLIGANGAGKTTLFDVISGVTVPQGGRIGLLGRDVNRWSPVRRSRAGLARTFQRAQVFGWLSVEDNLLVATEWHGGGGGVAADLARSPTRTRRERKRRERAGQVLDRCGLLAQRQVHASSLDIGSARMLELARALIDDPAVILMDEPTSGLDPAEARRLATVVHGVCDDLGTAVLLVEHDVGFVMDNCERIIVLDLGKVIAQGGPEEIRHDPAVRMAYLGPQAAAPGNGAGSGGEDR